ncbi:MAG: N-acetyltransferase [Rhodobacterales bacterium]|nr:N-acetyltransferase [Rhodobacterales bacterium]
MSRIQVRPITLPQDAAKFVKSWWPIYKDDPHWVPPLVFERKTFFDPYQNPYFKIAEVQLFMAFRDDKPVGTIAATVDSVVQENEPGLGLFGFFEFEDDKDISRALFAAAAEWLRKKGMKTARGPYNLSPNHEFGLLVDGFDTDPMIANPHNLAYYGDHYEAIGLEKSMDWYAYWMDKGPLPEKIEAIAERFLKRNPEVTLRKVNLDDWDNEVRLFREIYNDAWEDNWGHVYFGDDEFYWAAKNLKQIVNPDLCWFAYVGDECAGASITLPDYNQVAKKMNGSLFPFGWYHGLFGARKIDALRVWVLGIKKKHQRMPLGAPLYTRTWEEGLKLNIRGAEASLILETNTRMRGALVKLGARIYKTYRTYDIDLGVS